MKKPLQLLLFLVLSFSTTVLWAQDNGKLMSFQGTLYENGEPVDGDRTFTFTIALDNGETWTETQANVLVVGGLYAVELGAVNPLPTNLFYNVEERILTVNIGATTLGSTSLFAPFSSLNPENFMPQADSVLFIRETESGQFMPQADSALFVRESEKYNFRKVTESANDSITLIATIEGNLGQPTNAGIYGKAATDSTNIGVYGLAENPVANSKFQYGVWGRGNSTSPGAWAHGVMGVANTEGAIAYGVRGQVTGSGADFSAAMRGLNFIEATNGGVRYGGYFNTYNGDGSPFDGESVGVRGSATGSQNNVGIWGTANGAEGTNNWAAWLDGNVEVRYGGSLSVLNSDFGKRIELDYFEDNDAGSILTYNHKDQRSVLIGAASDKTGGLLNLYDSLENDVIELRATARVGDWPTDKRPHGQLTLDGPGGQNFYFGSKVWTEGGADAPVMQIFGKPVDDGNGNVGTPEVFFLTSEAYDDGLQQGSLSLIKEGTGRATLNYDNTSQLLNLVEGQGKYRFETNEQNSGVLKLMSAVDSVNVLIDSNGEKAGLIQLNDSLGRENLKLLSYPGGAGYMVMSAGAENIGENRVTAQYWGGQKPYINLIGRDADGNATGRAQLVTSEHGGSVNLQGPSTSNFWIGQQNWTNSNLPFFAMRGENTVPEGEGTRIPDGVQLMINRYDDGSDVGALHLARIGNDGTEEGVSMDFYQLQNLVNPSEYALNGVNGNQVAALRRRGDNFGMAQFNNDNNEMRAEIGSFGDNSGFMQLYAPNGSKNIQMGGSDGARDFGMLKIFDNNGQDMFQFQTEDNNGNQVPYFRMGNPQNLDENNYPKDAIRAGIASDPNGDGKYSTYFNLEGPDSPLVNIGSYSWEGNDGSNRARLALYGNDRDENNNVPERANISVAKDEGTTEFGILSLSNSAGGGFQVGSRSWENNNQGGAFTYTAIESTVDVDDGNGNTFRPWLVSQEFHQDENGNQYGTVRVNSTNNTGFVNINDSNSGNIDISGSLNQSSDARLKKNVSTLTSGLSMVTQLRGVRYNWKDETRTGNKIGFIAQEVEEVLPELVQTRENGFKGVNYAEMTAVLVEAVKELSAEVKALKAQNTALKAEASKVSDMEERLAKIEALLNGNAKTVNAEQKQ